MLLVAQQPGAAARCCERRRRCVPRRGRLQLQVVSGVRTLTRFITEHREAAGTALRLCDLPQRTLVCDGASLSFWLAGERLSKRGEELHVSAFLLGGEYRELSERTRRFARGLRLADVTLTCVFDPARLTAPDSARKVGTWGARLARGTLAAGELHTFITGGKPNTQTLDQISLPELTVEQVKRTLTEEGVRVVVSLSAEADDELIAAVRSGSAYAVLSCDSDFAVAEGCRYMPLEMLDTDALARGEEAAARCALAWVRFMNDDVAPLCFCASLTLAL